MPAWARQALVLRAPQPAERFVAPLPAGDHIELAVARLLAPQRAVIGERLTYRGAPARTIGRARSRLDRALEQPQQHDHENHDDQHGEDGTQHRGTSLPRCTDVIDRPHAALA
jgi:hypothetical protein